MALFGAVWSRLEAVLFSQLFSCFENPKIRLRGPQRAFHRFEQARTYSHFNEL